MILQPLTPFCAQLRHWRMLLSLTVFCALVYDACCVLDISACVALGWFQRVSLACARQTRRSLTTKVVLGLLLQEDILGSRSSLGHLIGALQDTVVALHVTS